MDKLRDFLKSWLGKVLLMLCLAPMVLLGLEGYLHGSRLTQNDVAKVGETTLSLGDLQRQVSIINEQLLMQVDASAIDEHMVNERAFDDILNRALLEEQARSLGMRISDEEITRILQAEPIFLENGQFSNARFAAFMQSQGLTKDRLFEIQRRENNLRTITSAILTNAIYPSYQIARLLDLQTQSRPLWIKRIAWQNFVDNVSVSDAQIDAYFEEHKGELFSDEMVDLLYLQLNQITVAKPTKEELNLAYDTYLKQNNMGQKQLSQILIADNDASKIAQVQNELSEGQAFESVAQKHSSDPTGKSGGYIGAYNPAVFGNDATHVSASLAGLNVGDVSAPVQTSFGTHIFKVTSIDEAPSFESIKDSLSQMVTEQKTTAAMSELVGHINNMIADGYGLQDIANQMDLKVETITDYKKQGQMIMGQPAIVRAAFDENLLLNGDASANIDVNGTMIWVQPTNHRPSVALTRQTAHELIKERLTVKQARELALTEAQKQAAAINSTNVDTLTSLGVVTRQMPLLSDRERMAMFENPSTDDIKAWAISSEAGATILAGGAIKTQSQARLDDTQRQQAANTMKSIAGEDFLNDYLEYLKTVHDIAINEELKKTL